MMTERKISRAAGIFYLLTFVSMPTLALYSSVRGAGFVTGSGPDGPVHLGIILEMIVALAGIGTAVTLYPVLKRYNESVALGLVSLRVLEAATIYFGIVSLLSMVSLRQDATANLPKAATIYFAIVSLLSMVSLRQDATANLPIGFTLAEQYSSTFLFGQSLIPAGNAVLLGYVLYRSRLVPRVLPILGFIGAVLLSVSWGGVFLGYIEQVSPATGLMALPVAAWEFSLGLYLLIKGFKSLLPGPVI